jgi:hypothetical protein
MQTPVDLSPTQQARAFQLMRFEAGEELLAGEYPTYEAAQVALMTLAAANPADAHTLSIWHIRQGIAGMWNIETNQLMRVPKRASRP